MKKALPLLLLTLLPACATIVGGREQDIAIQTRPAGAACILSNSSTTWTVEQTPGMVSIPRGFEPVFVTCSLAGAGSVNTTLTPKTRGLAYGNILLAGIPVMYDHHTGAGYSYEPENLMLSLGSSGASAPTPQAIPTAQPIEAKESSFWSRYWPF
jgi:hypothetical protein